MSLSRTGDGEREVSATECIRTDPPPPPSASWRSQHAPFLTVCQLSCSYMGRCGKNTIRVGAWADGDLEGHDKAGVLHGGASGDVRRLREAVRLPGCADDMAAGERGSRRRAGAAGHWTSRRVHRTYRSLLQLHGAQMRTRVLRPRASAPISGVCLPSGAGSHGGSRSASARDLYNSPCRARIPSLALGALLSPPPRHHALCSLSHTRCPCRPMTCAIACCARRRAYRPPTRAVAAITPAIIRPEDTSAAPRGRHLYRFVRTVQTMAYDGCT